MFKEMIVLCFKAPFERTAYKKKP